MKAVGIDLGGTKVEIRVFDEHWNTVAQRRIPTADSYAALLTDIAGLLGWADDAAGGGLPVGLGTAGLINSHSGQVTAANLPSHNQPFLSDLTAACARPIHVINDSQALGLSEAVFGAGQNARKVLALVLGTGVSGAFVADRRLQQGWSGTGGEFGHIAAPAPLVQAHGLPLVTCGCGQVGCVETLLSGPGLTRLAGAVMGEAMSPEEIAAQKADDARLAQVWAIWTALGSELIRLLTRTLDPDCIVLGGGLSRIVGVAEDLRAAAGKVQFAGFDVAPVLLAQGGDSSGARGAAYAAVQAGALDG